MHNLYKFTYLYKVVRGRKSFINCQQLRTIVSDQMMYHSIIKINLNELWWKKRDLRVTSVVRHRPRKRPSQVVKPNLSDPSLLIPLYQPQ